MVVVRAIIFALSKVFYRSGLTVEKKSNNSFICFERFSSLDFFFFFGFLSRNEKLRLQGPLCPRSVGLESVELPRGPMKKFCRSSRPRFGGMPRPGGSLELLRGIPSPESCRPTRCSILSGGCALGCFQLSKKINHQRYSGV